MVLQSYHNRDIVNCTILQWNNITITMISPSCDITPLYGGPIFTVHRMKKGLSSLTEDDEMTREDERKPWQPPSFGRSTGKENVPRSNSPGKGRRLGSHLLERVTYLR